MFKKILVRILLIRRSQSCFRTWCVKGKSCYCLTPHCAAFGFKVLSPTGSAPIHQMQLIQNHVTIYYNVHQGSLRTWNWAVHFSWSANTLNTLSLFPGAHRVLFAVTCVTFTWWTMWEHSFDTSFCLESLARRLSCFQREKAQQSCGVFERPLSIFRTFNKWPWDGLLAWPHESYLLTHIIPRYLL